MRISEYREKRIYTSREWAHEGGPLNVLVVSPRVIVTTDNAIKTGRKQKSRMIFSNLVAGRLKLLRFCGQFFNCSKPVLLVVSVH